MKIIKPGSEVTIKAHAKDNIRTAKVISACIYDKGYIQYKVVWWNGKSRQSEWLEENEVVINSTNDAKHQIIGFHNDRN